MPTTRHMRNGPQRPPVVAGSDAGVGRDRWARAASYVRSVFKSVAPAPPIITATIQNFDPPRVLVVVTGMQLWDVDRISVYREVNGVRTILRGSENIALNGEDAFVRTDAEIPFGVDFNYVAVFSTPTSTFEISSNTLQSNITEDVLADTILSDAITGVAVKLTIRSWEEKEFPRESSIMNTAERTIVVTGDRLSARSNLVVNIMDDENRERLEQLLKTATSGTIQLRQTSGLSDVDAYLAVLGDTRTRISRLAWHQERAWALSVVESTPWPSAMEARGYTLLDLSEFKATLQDIADEWATLLDIATADLS